MRLLFERLTTADQAFDLKQSVLDQVRRTLSGFSATGSREDLTVLSAALPAVVDVEHDSARQINAFANRMKALICHYEPRLDQVSVSLVKQNDQLTPYRLLVSGVLKDDSSQEWVQFPFDINVN